MHTTPRREIPPPGPAVRLPGMSRPGMLLFESLPRLLATGIACVLLASLIIGGLSEFWLWPGKGWQSRAFDRVAHSGIYAFGDLTGDGSVDRLVMTRPSPAEPPSFKIISNQPGQARPNHQLHLRGKVQLHGLCAVRAPKGGHWIAALSASSDTSTIYLNLFQTAESSRVVVRQWSQRIFSPAEHRHTWLHTPRLSSMLILEEAGRDVAYCTIGAAYLGWRGVLRIDLESAQPSVERFPCGLECRFSDGPALVGEDGRVWLSMDVFAPNNGNMLGGIADSLASLVLFSPKDGAFRLVNMGGKHNSLRSLVLPGRRHLLVYSGQELEPPDGKPGNALLWDTWQERVLRRWVIPNLSAVRFDGADAQGLDGRLIGLAGHEIVLLNNTNESSRILWRWPASWAAPRLDSGWLVCDEDSDISRVVSLDGRRRALLQYSGSGRVLVEPHGESFDEMIVHVAQPSSLVSYILQPLSVFRRWVANPVTKWTGEVTAFLFLLMLGWRLYRQEGLLRGILDDNAQPVGLLDQDGQLLFTNREFRQLLEDPVNGTQLFDALHRLAHGNSATLFQNERWFRWLKRSVRLAGRELGSVIFGIDETAQREADEGRRFRSLTGLITHELKTPMTPLRLGLDQLQRELARTGLPASEGVARVLSRMKADLDHMSRLIRQFMSMAGERRVRDRLDLVQVITELVRKLDLERMPELACSLRLPAQAMVLGDAEMLSLVMGGLIGNAIEAMDQRGRVSLAMVSVNDGAGRATWTLLIEDEGPGVPDSIRQQIWEPGFSTRKDGYGYGLYFARRVLQDMGGAIRLDRSASGGSLVRIDLPALQENATSGGGEA